MASWTDRYRSGDHFTVWNELRADGSDGVPERRREDAEEVARETMTRVAANVDTIVGRLSDVGYRFALPEYARQAPTSNDLDAIRQVEKAVGQLPLALRACLEIVGGVDLSGDGGLILPHVNYHEDPHEDSNLLPDPLVLPTGRYVLSEWSDWTADEAYSSYADEGFRFLFAPDELHKANISGGTHDIPLPSRSADPELLFVPRREGITLVEYLRISLAWAGFPGYDALPIEVAAPQMIESLRRDLLPF